VRQLATPAERKELREALIAKVPSLENQPQTERRELLGQVRAACAQAAAAGALKKGTVPGSRTIPTGNREAHESVPNISWTKFSP
jgi:hypothetical protein